jgi:hypothetical protein
LPALISLSERDKRLLVQIWQIVELGEHIPQLVIENRGSDSFFGNNLAKKQLLYRHAWSFKPKKQSKSLLGP